MISLTDQTDLLVSDSIKYLQTHLTDQQPIEVHLVKIFKIYPIQSYAFGRNCTILVNPREIVTVIPIQPKSGDQEWLFHKQPN